MKTRNLIAAFSLAAGMLSGPTHAAIVYHVDRVIGDGFVTGTITTDGTLGNLSTGSYSIDPEGNETYLPSNIIGLDLVFNDGVSTYSGETFLWDSMNGNPNFWATPNSLLYDFTAPGSILFLWGDYNYGYGGPFWELAQGGETVFAEAPEWSWPGDTSDYDEMYNARRQYRSWSSEVIIASVPEPGALALLVFGLAGVCVVRKLKRG